MHDKLKSCDNKINMDDWLKSKFTSSIILLEEIPRTDMQLELLWTESEHTVSLQKLYLENTDLIKAFDIRFLLIPFSWEVKQNKTCILKEYVQLLASFYKLRNEYTNGGYKINNLTTNSKFIISPNPELVYITLNNYVKYDSIQNLSDSLIRSLNDKKYQGYNDWRLASINEISSFIENYIGNNFDNEIFKKDDFIYLNQEEKKLDYKYCYQCTYKYNWGRDIPILTSTTKDYEGYDNNGNYVLKKNNIKCFINEGISIIKDRNSEEYVKELLPTRGIIEETRRNYPLYLLFLVR